MNTIKHKITTFHWCLQLEKKVFHVSSSIFHVSNFLHNLWYLLIMVHFDSDILQLISIILISITFTFITFTFNIIVIPKNISSCLFVIIFFMIETVPYTCNYSVIDCFISFFNLKSFLISLIVVSSISF